MDVRAVGCHCAPRGARFSLCTRPATPRRRPASRPAPSAPRRAAGRRGRRRSEHPQPECRGRCLNLDWPNVGDQSGGVGRAERCLRSSVACASRPRCVKTFFWGDVFRQRFFLGAPLALRTCHGKPLAEAVILTYFSVNLSKNRLGNPHCMPMWGAPSAQWRLLDGDTAPRTISFGICALAQPRGF